MSAVQDQIRDRIRSRGRGHVFIPKDFLDLGSRDAADQALSRLSKSSVIQCLGRGLYFYPPTDQINRGSTPVDVDEIADAIGRQTGSQVVPSGTVAASRLGLASEVATQIVYLTDGRTRQVRIGKMLIHIRHAAPKELPGASRASSIVFQALRHMKRQAVNDRIIARIRQELNCEQRIQLLYDAKYTTDWISAVVRQIANEEVEHESYTQVPSANRDLLAHR